MKSHGWVLGLGLCVVGCDAARDNAPCVDGWRVGAVDERGPVRESERFMDFEVGCIRQEDLQEGDTAETLRPIRTVLSTFDTRGRIRRMVTQDVNGRRTDYWLPDQGRSGTDTNSDGCVDQWNEPTEPVAGQPQPQFSNRNDQTDPRATIPREVVDTPPPDDGCVRELDVQGNLLHRRCESDYGISEETRTLTEHGETWVFTWDGDKDGVVDERRESWTDETGGHYELSDGVPADGLWDRMQTRGPGGVTTVHENLGGDPAWDAMTRTLWVIVSFTPDVWFPVTMRKSEFFHQPVSVLRSVRVTTTQEDRLECWWMY